MIPGLAIPGMPNTHSHAFQRGMVGQAEWRGSDKDSFWSWRETMYELAGRATPEWLLAVAAQLYMELLEGGFTQVVEFNYLHHDPSGDPYSDRSLMQQTLLDAARRVGMGITLAPVLYQWGGFGRKPLSSRQQRFFNGTEEYIALLDDLRQRVGTNQRMAAAFHSLRAVELATVEQVLDALPSDCPVHIHIAEQPLEVEDSLQHLGLRPVQALMDRVDLNLRWNLVHATHLDATELERVAKSGACVGLCPMTEANLGDGIFPVVEYQSLGGRFSIGTDSHVETTVAGELRMLEYGQRLRRLRRCQLATEESPDVALSLWGSAAAAAAPVVGTACGTLAVGSSADIVVLDSVANADTSLVARHVFGDRTARIRDVYAAGEKVVENGRHRLRERVEERFANAITLP